MPRPPSASRPFLPLLALVLLLGLAGCGRPVETPPPPLTAELLEARMGMGTIRAFAFSPDSDGHHGLAAVASATGRAYLWDLASQRFTEVLDVARAPRAAAVSALVFTADGTRLVTAGEDGDLKVWETRGGHLVKAMGRNGSAVLSLVLGSDGKVYAGAANGHLIAWDLQADHPLLDVATKEGAIQALAATAATLYTGGATGFVASWKLADLSALTPRSPSHNGAVLSLALSGDGAHLFSGGVDGQVRDLNPTSLAVTRAYTELGGPVTALATSGTRVAAGSRSQRVAWWDLSNDRGLQPLTGNHGAVLALAFSADGNALGAGGEEKMVVLHFLNAKEPPTTLPHEIGHPAIVNGIAWSPDNRWIAVAGNGPDVLVWDAASHALDRIVRGGAVGNLQAVAWSSQGLLATAAENGSVLLFDAAGRLIGTGHHKSQVNDVAFSADGGMLASGSWDHDVRLWKVAADVAAGGALLEAATLHGHRNGVSGVAFSGDGKRLVSSAWDHTVRLWDLGTPAPGKSLPGALDGPVFCCAFAPTQSLIVAGGWHGGCWFWNADAAGLLGEEPGEKDVVFTARFSPDGKSLATGAADRTVRFWNPATHVPGREFVGFRGGVKGVAWTRSGSDLAIGCSDGEVFTLPTPDEVKSGAAVAPASPSPSPSAAR